MVPVSTFVKNTDFFKCPLDVVAFDIVTIQGLLQVPTRKRKQPLGEHDDSSVASESLPTSTAARHRSPCEDRVKERLTGTRFKECPARIIVKEPFDKDCFARIATRDFSQGSRQGTPHKDRHPRIASRNASKGSLRKDRVKERLTRIAPRNASQGSLHKNRFARATSQEPLCKGHFTRITSQGSLLKHKTNVKHCPHPSRGSTTGKVSS